MDGSAKFLGGTGEKIGPNVEKRSFSQGLGREFFQFVPAKTTPSTPFLTKHTSMLTMIVNFKKFNAVPQLTGGQ